MFISDQEEGGSRVQGGNTCKFTETFLNQSEGGESQGVVIIWCPILWKFDGNVIGQCNSE